MNHVLLCLQKEKNDTTFEMWKSNNLNYNFSQSNVIIKKDILAMVRLLKKQRAISYRTLKTKLFLQGNVGFVEVARNTNCKKTAILI